MNENEKLNRAFEAVDDTYIMAAMKPPRFARRVWMRVGVAVACLLLLIGAYFPVRNAIIMGQYKGGAVFADTEQKGSSLAIGSQNPSAPPLPWEETVYLKGTVETCSYQPKDKVELYVEIGLKNDYLGKGDLMLTIRAPDFDIAVEGHDCVEGNVIIEDAAPDTCSAEQPLSFKVVLTPVYSEIYAMGTISLAVGFVPEDGEAFFDKIEASDVPQNYYEWQTIFFENGVLKLESATLDYAADMVELRLDTSPRGASDVWEIMIAQHYKVNKISAEEFSNLYCTWAYRDRIYASIDSYMTVEHTVRFSYMSKNIRYRCDEYIDAPEMWSLYQDVQTFEMGDWDDYNSPEADASRRALAEYILRYMREQGIITAEEYERESALMAATKNVGNFSVGYDQNIAPYARVIEKYMYTH